MQSVNYVYEVKKVGPCSKCGFSGSVNDHEAARKAGKRQLVVECPECKGTGREVTWVLLEEAIGDMVHRGFDLGGGSEGADDTRCSDTRR